MINEGYAVEKERVTVEPGPPVIQRVYYWIESVKRERTTREAKSKRKAKPVEVDLLPDESVTAALQRRLLNGESLTGPQIAEEYNVSRSLMSQAVALLRQAGYEVTNSGGNSVTGPGAYSVTSFHKKRKRSSKSWVDEVPDDAPVSLLPPELDENSEGTEFSLPPFGATGLEVALLARKQDGTVVLGLRNSHAEWLVPVGSGVKS